MRVVPTGDRRRTGGGTENVLIFQYKLQQQYNLSYSLRIMRAPGAAGPPRTCQVQAAGSRARCTVNTIYQIPGIHLVHSLVRDLHMYEQSRTVGQHSKRTAGSCFACSLRGESLRIVRPNNRCRGCLPPIYQYLARQYTSIPGLAWRRRELYILLS